MRKMVYWKGLDLNSEPVDGIYEIVGMGAKVARLRLLHPYRAWVEMTRSAYDSRVERGEIQVIYITDAVSVGVGKRDMGKYIAEIGVVNWTYTFFAVSDYDALRAIGQEAMNFGNYPVLYLADASGEEHRVLVDNYPEEEEPEPEEVDWGKRMKEQAHDAAQGVIDFTNCGCANMREFVDTVTGCHNTLQQNVMRVFMMCIKQWSEKTRFVDGRNEATVKLAKAIMEAVADKDGLPFI
jgi:hypothetical protein